MSTWASAWARASSSTTGPQHVACGLPRFDVETWYGLFVPAATPPDIITRLHDASVQTLQNPALAGKLREQGFTIVGNSSEAFGTFVRSEVTRWGQLIRDANIKGE